MLGIDLNRARKLATFLNSGPSSIEGFDGFVLAGLRMTKPSTKEFRYTCTSNKSDVALTGRNLERGTLMPIAFSKN
ncbi:Os09g0553250 [Oryza sativa Japonica Group]|uniref:Os09g0553250 protein n=1 Tax=Oryza sativa subsp. japonica TaxID=39947 RepID=A0A0P0XQ67_ORYSJ|nr:hypothetical protein EE612_049383 [Oryza sativa]BAT09325.1 Os09g0553250 [Oryza sativa Japonica Group]